MRWLSMIAVLCTACSASSVATTRIEKRDAQSAKADGLAPEEVCLYFGFEPTCDICGIASWYDDGVCDSFCLKPDPDCGATTPAADDTLHTALEFDTDALTASATITVQDDGDGIAWFHVPSPQTRVTHEDGSPAVVTPDVGNNTYLGVSLAAPLETLKFDYTFSGQRKFQGYDSAGGFSFSWPNYCGDLFPCDNDPSDGTTFSVNVKTQSTQPLIYPQDINAVAPPYMFAFAFGDYVRTELGQTPSGTSVYVWAEPGEAAAVHAGTQSLVAHFAFLENTYGSYLYGDEVGSVSVAWGAGAVGGMEHHPYWHVASGAFSDPYVHAHEAAHGWFGNGVRIACWEDFVLSEGLASYLAARAVAEVGGPQAEAAIWNEYDRRLDAAIARGDTTAWIPDTCEIEIENHPLWSSIPYMKGAFFLRTVAARAGTGPLDAAIRSFYLVNRETATTMAAFIAHLESELRLDLHPEVTGWLRSLGRP